MLVTVSPAKKLDWSEVAADPVTLPEFPQDAAHLAEVAAGLGVAGLKKLMGISDALARLNHDRFLAFPDRVAAEARPASLAFAGDTYQGLEMRTLDADARRWSETHLRILSGLYGVLRPFDLIQPYRLEMGSRLATDQGRNLYEYWGARIAGALNRAGAAVGTGWLLNCASQEYFGAVDLQALELQVVTPVFLEEKDGVGRVVSFHAKRARGAMARFVMENRLTDPAALAEFETGGYRYQPEASSAGRPVFQRSAAAAAA